MLEYGLLNIYGGYHAFSLETQTAISHAVYWHDIRHAKDCEDSFTHSSRLLSRSIAAIDGAELKRLCRDRSSDGFVAIDIDIDIDIEIAGIRRGGPRESEDVREEEGGVGMDGVDERMALLGVRDVLSEDHCQSLAESDAPAASPRRLNVGNTWNWQLAESGTHVVMAVRNTKAAHELSQKWQSEWSGMGLPLNIEVMELDLLSLESVVRFTEAWNARSVPLHVLINNAGIFSIGEPQKFSKNGYEEHLQVNHLAPALLSLLLLPSLIRGSPSRIVNLNSIVSSSSSVYERYFTNNPCNIVPQMHYVGFVDPEDMNMNLGKRKFSSLAGYGSSKLAQIMFSSILHKRLPAEAGISVVCVSPGIVHTNVARDLPQWLQGAYHLIPYFIFTSQEGARSALFAATDPQVSEYCALLKSDDWPVCALISHDCRPTTASEEAHNLPTSIKVWEKTLAMIGLPADAVERLIEGEQVQCQYGLKQD
ncbi:hypothetical protein Syun_022387 [Stephania yunnanensis]|uniref:Uncharacterized protein n=1 Tax=Stephania yunnanensis TaxID=152371 RepID=A0AAP0F7V8_9MAGN